MNCSEVRARWPALLDGKIGETERASVDEHVRACPACERGRQSLLVSENLLQRYARFRRAPPAGLVDRIMSRLDAGARPTILRELGHLAAAAALLVAVSAYAIGRASVDPVVEKMSARAEQTRQYVMEDLPKMIAASLSDVWRESKP